MTIVETRAVTGGVDTHADVHVAAALDQIGGLLGTESFPTTPAGYAGAVRWLRSFGTVTQIGIEGTGSYGAGLARHVAAAGIRVLEVDRSDRQERRRSGKSDTLDAVSAARAALSGRASGVPRGRDGTVEAIRALSVAKRSARSERIQTINHARSLVVTGPDDIRARFATHSVADLVAELAALRPRTGEVVAYATRMALRELGRRVEFLDGQLVRLDELIIPLVSVRAPGLLALYGVGAETAATLLVAAGDHPERLRSEAASAHLCAAAPIPASSGKTTGRHRLNPAGDRQANTPFGGSRSPRWDRTRRRASTSNDASKRGFPNPRSCAASSVTSPARSIPTSAPSPADGPFSGDGLTRESAAASAGLITKCRPLPSNTEMLGA